MISSQYPKERSLKAAAPSIASDPPMLAVAFVFQQHEIPAEKKIRVGEVNKIIGNSDKNNLGDCRILLWAGLGASDSYTVHKCNLQ
jgi:hypothetical protein